jgi:glycosyltransferase involved in cell wall biosynthesis
MATLICFSTVDWNHLWYHPQALMSRFAQDGHQVIYVDTIGLRSPKLKDLRRIFLRMKNSLQSSSRDGRITKEGISVFSPFILPFLNSRLACYINVKWLVSKLNKLTGSLGSEKPIFWIYLPTWTVSECVRRIPHQLLVYNSIDALDASPDGVSRNYAIAETEILKRADLVLTTSETLYQEKLPYNKNTHWIPSGVDDSWFDACDPASDVTDLPGPRIGFFGAIDHRLDLDLIVALAKKHEEWTFVLIGTVRCDVSILRDKKNVYFLGPKPHSELVRYVSGLDVVFLPYVLDDFTRHIQPAKLYECLAVGKPVVATRLPSLEPFDGFVYLAEGTEAFDRALKDAIAEDKPELQEERREVSRANSWERRYQEILTLVKDAMP